MTAVLDKIEALLPHSLTLSIYTNKVLTYDGSKAINIVMVM
jgi:hypothetical protein